MGKKVKKEAEPPAKDVFDPLNIESKKTATVVLMLKSEEDEVLAKACEAIYRFADKCDDNKLQLLDLGAMESLIRLINHEEKTVKRYACMAFGVMAGHSDVRRYLRKTDSITAAIQLLGDEDDVCNEFSSLFLSHMSTDFSCKLSIGKADGVEPLINLLASPDPDVQKNSVQAICNLVQDFQNRMSVRELGGIPPLLELLKSEYAIIQELALNTLASLTQDGESRTALKDNEGLEQLVEFLGNKEWEDLHVHCLCVLSNCMEDNSALDDIRNTGGMEKLLAIVTEQGVSPQVQATTARALARSARNVENSKILHEQEVEKTLITMLGSNDEHVVVAACEAVASLSNNLAAKDTFGKSEGLPPLLDLLSSDNPAVREVATLALANLTLNNTNNCNEIVSCGGVEQLLPLLRYNKDAVVVNSASCLINMAQDIVIRNDVFKRGIIASLAGPLKSPSTRVQSKAAQTAAAYVVGADARTEMRMHGCLEPLINLLRSNDHEVRRNASWALLACCGDPPTAAAITKLGGLEILQDINSSDQRCNSHSVAALDTLLDSNLSAKYSLTGKLAAHNTISDGFYDVGQLRPGSKFLSLDEHAKEEVNQRRPIILVNCKSCDPRDSETPEPIEFVGELRPTSASSAKATGEQVSPAETPVTGSQRARSPNVQSRDEMLSVKTTHDDTSDKGGRVSSKASYTRSRKKKDREVQMKEEAERARAEKEDQSYKLPVDTALQGYIDDVTNYILPMATTKEQIVALAQYVVEKMGGEVEKGKLAEFSWELSVAELKVELKSNIIPIGRITHGIHYHRALMYKVLADKIGVPCTLVRGEYNRAWNEVMVAASLDAAAPRYPPTRYIVNLMDQPGLLIRADSPQAIQYQSI